jgi:hypothetical protein
MTDFPRRLLLDANIFIIGFLEPTRKTPLEFGLFAGVLKKRSRVGKVKVVRPD